MDALRIGVLGAAKIAPAALLLPAQARQDVQVVAVAARDGAAARAFADAHGIEHALEGYDALLVRDDVDAIYNALPPSRHADLSIAALAAGKHVLCEKPFALDAAEAQAMVAAAARAGRVLMEAFHYRYHPLFGALLEVVRGGSLGTLREVRAQFVVNVPPRPGELRFDPALGGGGLMDLGTYCVHWCRTVAAREPTVRTARMRMGETGVDLHARAELDFGDGLVAHVDCGMDAPFAASLVVVGEHGELRADNPLVPQFGHRLQLSLEGAEAEVRTFSREPTYAFQLQAFVDAVRGGVLPPTSGADPVRQMTVIDAIRACAVREHGAGDGA
jgi:predicted dehydrogenase